MYLYRDPLGWGQPYRATLQFEVKHILEVLDEFVGQGLIRTRGMEEARLTYHDPCQIARKGGVSQAAAQPAEPDRQQLCRDAGCRRDELVLRRRRRCQCQRTCR